MNNSLSKFKILDGAKLKWIAVITMVIDHIGASYIVYKYFQNSAIYSNETFNFIHNIYVICRMIGRISFPIFCFLLVEGFVHTKDIKKYIIRLFIFTLISEIPFDLAFSHTLINLKHQSVMLTFLVAIIMLCAFQFTEKKVSNIIFLDFIKVLIIFAFYIIARLLKCDYSWRAMLLIAAFYQYKNKKVTGVVLPVVLFAALEFLGGSLKELGILISIIPLIMYNGNRGHQIKYFFYAFYPAHLILLYLLGLI